MADEEREVTARSFRTYGLPLVMMISFKYLRRVISETEDNCPEVVSNLAQGKTVWRRMSHILSREGTTPLVSGFFLKVLIQAILIFVVETWMVTPRMGTDLGGFQTQVARRLTRHFPRRATDRTRKYTSEAAAREAAGFLTMGEFIRRRQSTSAHYIAT